MALSVALHLYSRSHELFRKYIDNSEIITISEATKTRKKNLFLNREITRVNENFTDLNFIKSISINGKKVLILSIDTTELYSDDEYVEKEILNAVSKEIEQIEYDMPLLITHYSVLGTDELPLKNSAALIDFIQKYKIEYVFCGYTHELEIMRVNDLYQDYSFTQSMCGSLSSSNYPNDDNMFLYYENVGSKDMHLHLIRIFLEMGKVHFKQETVF
ncbi:metallophosphoesterase [Methanolobus sp. ZRKC5]|uniref:metallophosphoesterase n=1 Tax=unclassified Methanolobus TaxID=2629569 RepID=UPI00313BB822